MAQYTDYIAPFTDLVKNPHAFFKTASEKTLVPVLIFLAINYIITQLLGLVISIPYLGAAALINLFGIIFGVVFAGIAWLIAGAIAHLAVKIVGFSGDIIDTFKVVGYSWSLVMWWGIASALITTTLALAGVLPDYDALNDPTINPAEMISEGILAGVIGLAFLVIVVLHASYLMIAGFKTYHKMPQNKAILAVIVSWAIIAIPAIIVAIVIGSLFAVVSQI